eukprot:Rmarinus@m.7452
MGRLSIVLDSDQYLIEQGNTSDTNDKVGTIAPYVKYDPENWEGAAQWYRDYFWGKDHVNYLADESAVGPVALSITESKNEVYVICRTSEGIDRRKLPASRVKMPAFAELLSKIFSPCGGSVAHPLCRYLPGVLRELNSGVVATDLDYVGDDALKKDLLEMEDVDANFYRKFKIGVVYSKKGQGRRAVEDEMFSNTEKDMSPEFHEFLKILGDRVKLKGWKGYAGGLDVKEDRYGTDSVCCTWQNSEVMYHVSTFLPQSTTNKQQIQKKKHIGNDTCCIVFQEPGTAYDPNAITTNVVRCYFVVTPVAKDKYRIAFAYKEGVDTHDPKVPDQPIVEASKLRDYILTKVINHQINVYQTPAFTEKLASSRNGKLKDIAKRYLFE